MHQSLNIDIAQCRSDLFSTNTTLRTRRFAFFVARLYDQKRKMKSAHDNLNRLRVKIAKQKDVSLAKLPPCEASFVQPRFAFTCTQKI
jgi:hypothetical protein